MGQRTQILTIQELKDGTCINDFHHLQWGYGENMFKRLMNLMNYSTYSKYPSDEPGINIDDVYFGAINLFKEDLDYLVPREKDNPKYSEEIKEIQDLMSKKLTNDDMFKILNMGDNNDGYLIVSLKEERYHMVIDKIQVLTYDMKNISVGRYLREYEVDPIFVEMLDNYMKYYGVEEARIFDINLIKDDQRTF